MRTWLVVTAVFVIAGVAGAAAPAGDLPGTLSYDGAPAITADAAAVIDLDTGLLLYAKQGHVRRSPASLTKVMTALVVLEQADLREEVVASSRAAYTGGARMGLATGDRFTMGEMLYGLLLESGNDAAVAIAEHISGSVEGFAMLMTDRAWILGADRTIFANPHGFTFPGHLSTAIDLCRIGREAARIPLLSRITRTTEFMAVENVSGEVLMLKTTNRLLFEHPDATGMKTGTTPSAGRCLMFTAERDGRRILGVVLHSDDRYGDARRLIDHALTDIALHPVLIGGEPVLHVQLSGRRGGVVAVGVRDDLLYPGPPGEMPPLRFQVDVQRPLVSPLESGQVVGTITVTGASGPVVLELVALNHAGFRLAGVSGD